MKKKIKDLLFSILLILFIGNTFILFIGDNYTWEVFLYGSFFSLSCGLPLFYTFKYLTIYLDKHYPWLKMPVRRLFFGFLIQSVLLLAIVFVVSFLFFLLIERRNDMQEIYSQSMGAFKIGMGFIIASTFIVNGVMFFLNWKASAINEEKLKREALAHQHEALKNQVNPHFLFNNLTALSSLIYEDQDKASEFVKQLSNVYRYVLDQKDKELTPLTTELKFLESYLYLYKIRHGENLNFELKKNSNQSEKAFIIPLCLQMLIENAIKHNIISDAQKLYIHLTIEDEELLVSNNIQDKPVTQISSGIGLENIKLRYSFLTNKKVKIDNYNGEYRVSIPLIYEA